MLTRSPTTSMVIEAIVECSDPDYQDELRAKLQALCELACEEQRREFRKIASRVEGPRVLQ